MPARAYRWLLHAGAVAAALLLGVLALLVTADVVARNLGWGTLQIGRASCRERV